jgi:hypothetical protein
VGAQGNQAQLVIPWTRPQPDAAPVAQGRALLRPLWGVSLGAATLVCYLQHRRPEAPNLMAERSPTEDKLMARCSRNEQVRTDQSLSNLGFH